MTSNDESRAGPSYSRSNTIDETDSITSIYAKYYAPSVAPSYISEAESVPISGSMPPRKILSQLCRHGCIDVTYQLKPNSITQNWVANGGSGDVYRETLQDGRQVGIKCLRISIGMNEAGEKQIKSAARELHIWSKVKHPNIQELIGVAIYYNRVAMISPWMKNGNLSWYISQHPEADRYRLCVQAASAVAYLRVNGVVHGDIKGANYLVSDDDQVKLTDFGSSTINQCSMRFTSPDSLPHGTLRWTAPEIFLGESKQTYEGDVYALGMTILEIITGSIPWSDMLDPAVMHNLIKRAHPSRPKESMPIGDELSDTLWELITRCWASEPQRRPFATKVRDEMKVIYKQHRLAVYGPEGIDMDVDESLTETYTPIEIPSEQTPSDPGPSPVLSTKNSVLDRFLRRSSNRSMRSLVSNKRRPSSLSSLASFADISQTQSMPPLEADRGSVISTSSRWSGSILGLRRGLGHRQPSSISSSQSISETPRYELPGAIPDVYQEGAPRIRLPSFLLEPAFDVDLNGSADTLQLLDKEWVPAHGISSGTRKALMIGAPWSPNEADRLPADRTFISLTLEEVSPDLERMESVFKERGYSVQRLMDGFNRATALSKVAEFLDDSRSGDIRLVLFSGLAYGSRDGTLSLTPPETSAPYERSLIPFKEWEQNIRDHSHPGVVVFSIMAHMWSGQIMRQEFDRHVWEAPALIKAANKDEPTYLTFASSDERGYCAGSTPPPEQVPIGDHFIHALVGAIRSVDAATSTWDEFFEEFDRQFLRTRSYASLLERQTTGDLNLNMRLNHPQAPRFSASASVELSEIF